MPRLEEITLLLQKAENGDGDAANALFVLVEDDLKVIARKRKRAASANVDFSTTMLVDDAFCRLVGTGATDWGKADRRKFFGYISNKMHDLLIEAIRAQQAAKRGGGRFNVGDENLDHEDDAANPDDLQTLIDLRTALDKFEEFAPQDAMLFRLRYFLGCTFDETAEMMELSATEAKRSFQRSRLWLQSALKEYDGGDV